MFLINMQFTAPLSEIDRYVGEHRDYLATKYEDGSLLFGGRKVPRQGGITVSTQTDKSDVEALLAADPLIKHQLAEYTLIEFEPVMCNTQMTGILGLV
jgi:uncharacterized protein YciI